MSLNIGYAKFHEIRFESTKITRKQFLLTNSRAISTILRVSGFDLHSSSPEPINFFGAQSSLVGAQLLFGGHKQSFGVAQPRNAPQWRQGWIESYISWPFNRAHACVLDNELVPWSYLFYCLSSNFLITYCTHLIYLYAQVFGIEKKTGFWGEGKVLIHYVEEI